MQEKLKKTRRSVNYQMPRDFHVEISRSEKKISVTVYGVISVIDIDGEKCILKIRGGKLVIRGKNLSVSVFENSILDVEGSIEGVDLLC